MHARQGDEEIGPILGNHLEATYAFDQGIIATFHSHRRTVRPGPRPGGLEIHGTEGIFSTATATCCTAPIPTGTRPWANLPGR